jgi:hypothetical protein
MVKLRKDNDVLIYGNTLLDKDNRDVFALQGIERKNFGVVEFQEKIRLPALLI